MFANYKPVKRAVLKQGATQGMELVWGEELLFSAFFSRWFIVPSFFTKPRTAYASKFLISFFHWHCYFPKKLRHWTSEVWFFSGGGLSLNFVISPIFWGPRVYFAIVWVTWPLKACFVISLHREAVVRGEDGTIRGTVKVKGTLNRSSKGWCMRFCVFSRSEKKGGTATSLYPILIPL